MGGVARRNHCATHSALLLLSSERKKSIRLPIGECWQRVPARRSNANVQRIRRGCSEDTIARTYNPRHGHVREDRYKIKLMRTERDIISSVYSSALRIRLIDSSNCSEEDLVQPSEKFTRALHTEGSISNAENTKVRHVSFGARQHRQQQQKRGRTKNNVYSSMPSRGNGRRAERKTVLMRGQIKIRRRRSLRDILYEAWNIRSAGSYAGLRLAAAYVYIVYNNCRAPAAGIYRVIRPGALNEFTGVHLTTRS
uniref:Uncharacterized protein n=1 Tax=Trichogramma kaykai TaxID=54128 RepID=A0ABD2W6S8_9HYME